MEEVLFVWSQWHPFFNRFLAVCNQKAVRKYAGIKWNDGIYPESLTVHSKADL
jgi:hypothetical protein